VASDVRARRVGPTVIPTISAVAKVLTYIAQVPGRSGRVERAGGSIAARLEVHVHAEGRRGVADDLRVAGEPARVLRLNPVKIGRAERQTSISEGWLAGRRGPGHREAHAVSRALHVKLGDDRVGLAPAYADCLGCKQERARVG